LIEGFILGVIEGTAVGEAVVYTGVPNCQYRPVGLALIIKFGISYTVIDNTNEEL